MYTKNRRLILSLSTIIVCAIIVLVATNRDSPEIVIDRGPFQSIGRYGPSQNFYNVTGNVNDVHGIFKLSYSLNGNRPTKMSIGPDGRRLAKKGDFNADIPVSQFIEGSNSIALVAFDWLGRKSTKTVELIWKNQGNHDLPTKVVWEESDSISKVAQIVDGPWIIENGLLKSPDLAYDRLVAVGSVAWSDYEVLTSFRILEIDYEAIGDPINARPALGIILRWQGHSDYGKKFRSRIDALLKGDWQPLIGWTPWGGGLWCDFDKDGTAKPSLITNWPTKHFPSGNFQTEQGIEYLVRLQVVSEKKGVLYSLKIWQSDQPEPNAWSVQKVDKDEPLLNGSVLLLAHCLIAEFGDLEIRAMP